MKVTKKLALRREALGALDRHALGAIAGAATPTPHDCPPMSDTCYSCLDYVSCRLLDCLTVSGG